ncbi:MAG: hypothetical protein ACI9SJ_000705 [Flavobacteriaceae bacterium]|uniref:hypothetical protein n=1 Tax=Candidatus Marifrigoribacter sp. Uisw_064 TaxID=3230970 RepID=UPI003AE814FD
MACTFVWYLEQGDLMTEAKLTAYFNSYYDGLMDVTMKAPDGSINPNKIDNSICLFIKTNDGFKGRMRVYDKFFSKEYIILNIQIKESYCTRAKKQIISCDISPKDFNHEIWNIFDEVTLKVPCD